MTPRTLRRRKVTGRGHGDGFAVRSPGTAEPP